MSADPKRDMPSSSAAQLKSEYAAALALQRSGQDQEALYRYAAIVQKNANIAEVHFQIARIFLKNHRLEAGLTHIKAAVRLKPGVPDIWKVYAELVRALSDPAERDAFRQTVKASELEKRVKGALSVSVELLGKTAPALGAVSLTAYQAMRDALSAGRPDEAHRLATAELSRAPNHGPVLAIKAAAEVDQGRAEAAQATVALALKSDPDCAEAHVVSARVMKARADLSEAIKHCNNALRLAPGLPEAIRLRAECKSAANQGEEAIADYRRLLSINPKAPEAHLQLAQALFAERDYAEAAEVLRNAVRKGHKGYPTHMLLGRILAELGDHDDALSEFEAAARLRPDHPGALAAMGELKQTLGRFDEGDADFRKAIALDPTRGDIARIYLSTKKIDLDDDLVSEMATRFEDKEVSPYHRAHFGFALAKAHEDQKDYGNVFRYLHPANALMREIFPYDVSHRVTHVDRLIASYDSVDWSAPDLGSTCDFAPIFVTGMPRSGTTLVEQIIASHSRVTGAGEVGVAPKKMLSLLGAEDGTYKNLSDVPVAALQRAGQDYEQYMRTLYPEADLISDKSIQPFGFVGPLKLAMPKARFVVVRRDPRDNLLSIYKNVFPEGTHLYAYSLSDLAEYYKQFLRLVGYWRDVCPDWIYEIHYEDLVANPEEEARKLIAACGLDWEDACLEFHKTERRVKTLSLYQVRQPMYRSSTKAWERYGTELDALMEALGPEHADVPG